MKRAVLLLNMGGANNIDEVELFLKNMFADKNILPMNKFLRKFIANIIISKRINEVKENFKIIGSKSPLTNLTNELIDKLSKEVNMPIYMAMRYVPPFSKDALLQLKKDWVGELILFPMYPQYSTTTTLSSIEDIKQICDEINYYPTIKIINSYYDDFEYIKASYTQILNAIKGKNSLDYDLLLSAHGLPVSIIKNGDPYEKQVEANVSALKTYLKVKGLEFNEIKLVYQSKVGNSSWLEPSLVDTIRNPTNRKVLIYPLAFTIDNSETIFELDIETREIAQKLKYNDFIVAKCFNANNIEFIDFMVKKINNIFC